MYQCGFTAIAESVSQASSQPAWGETLALLGNIASILGLISILIAIWQLCVAKKERRIAARRDDFAHVCRSPAEEIEKYTRVYEQIAKRDETRCQLEKLRERGFQLTCRDYFYERLHEDMLHTTKPASYNFPLVYTKSWVRSENPNLKVIAQSLVEDKAENECEDYLRKKARTFLDTFHLQVDDYPSFLADAGKPLWNDPTFEIQRASYKDNTLSLDCQCGQYFHFVTTYELMVRELYFHIYLAKKNRYVRGSRQLLSQTHMLRDSIKLDAVLSQNAFQPRHPVKLGLNVFVIMKTETMGYTTFIQQRGQQQVEYPGFYHVAPAGTFAPMCTWDRMLQKQYTLSYTVIREFLEEICNLEKADRDKTYDPFSILSLPMENDKNTTPGTLFGLNPKTLEKIPDEQKGKYSIIPTGFFFDLIAMKPEMTLVLYLSDPITNEKILKAAEGNWEGPCKPFKIQSKGFEQCIRNCLSTEHFLPAGAAAVAEGMKYFHTEILKEVNNDRKDKTDRASI